MRNLPKRHKGKAKRWPKGQSSNSNPETRKFRDNAKSRFFHHESSEKSTLTVDAVKALNAFHDTNLKTGDRDGENEIDDTISFDSWGSGRSFKTFASDWSECSNMSFNRLLKKFEPTSSLHKEMLAVLAAVTDVIKGNDGKETSTEYFAALMTALSAAETEDSITAILSLLAMCIKTVPHEVLRLKFSESSKILLEVLAKYCDVENAVIMQSLIGCLSVLMRVQDPGVWSHSSTLEIFHSVLVFVTHTKPRVRKSAQHAVSAILKASAMFSECETHPAAISTAKYCIQQIEKGESLGSNTTTLHVLGLLKDVIGVFPKNYIKLTCETILKYMTLGTPLTVICYLEVLHGLFTSQPSNHHMPAILNAQILNALYDYQPSKNDSQTTLAWITVMQEAHKALVRSPELCLENLTKFFVTLSHLWLNEKAAVVRGAILALKTVTMDCLPPCSECKNYNQVCRNIFSIVETGLKYQYQNAWSQLFNLLGVLFEIIGKSGESYMINCLKSLASLRDSQNFLHRTELDHTIGKAIRTLGPETVLKAIPIVITGNEINYEFKTSWLLPLLKENVHSSSLNFFIDYFLPLAVVCEKKFNELNLNNEKIGAHVYELLQLQIWSILPSFCNNAQDVSECFKSIAKILGNLISGRKQLRIPAMTSLRKLITRSQERQDKGAEKELGRFARNYLPILFTLYTTKPQGSDEGGERLAAFDTIKVYLTVASDEIHSELFDKAIKMMETSEIDIFLKESVLDLMKLLIPYQDENRLALIYDKCITIIKLKKVKKEEKKAYRLLEVLVASESASCKMFMTKKSKELLTFTIKSLNRNDIKYRGARLRCILYLLKYVPHNSYSTLKEIIPEAVICCKDINKRTRAIAFKLLEQIFILCRKWSDKEEEDIIREYLNMILVGLTGTPSLVSATVLALAKLTSMLRSELPSDVIKLLLESICLLLALTTREIVGSALTYLKVFTTAIPKPQLFSYVPPIMKAILSMVDDCRNHFRLKTRDLLDRLLRKFGYDTIRLLVPENDIIMHKRLKNLRRIYLKKKSCKAEIEDKDSELEEFASKAKPKSIDEILASSDDESSDDVESSQKKGKVKDQTYIEEDPENVIDLLTPTASGKITAVKPVIKEKKKNNELKFAPDGRIIVMDDKEIEGDSNSDMEDIESMMSEVLIGKKRKLSISSEGSRKYEAGGTGIHRPVKTPRIESKREKTKSKKKEVRGVKTGKEYQAKKARGDVKLKGKPDPYAYIPLSRNLLSKRKRQKNRAQFKGVIQAALKGAKNGYKAKAKKQK